MSAPKRALVLGGGGGTGNAWLIGVVAGLAEAGVDVSNADVTIGTSAGATAAAQLTAASAADLLAATLSAAPGPPPRRGPAGAVNEHLERTSRIIAASRDMADLRRRVGAEAIETAAALGDERQQRWRSIVASRLPGARWPERTLLVTVVDATSGEPVVLDRDSGVDLVDAVAASTSGGPAYTIGSRHYIDGGYRTNADNADLATGCDRVLVLSPLSGRTRTPFDWGTHLSTQVEQLRAAGSRVETVFPDPDAEHLFGANAMDVSLRPAAARVGHEQGIALAERISELWR